MLDRAEQKIVDDVKSYGWSIMKVAPRVDSDDPAEWFAYTIGLPKTFGWPEMICFGLDINAMHHILNDAVEECRQRDIIPGPDVVLLDVLNDCSARLIDGSEIPDSYFGFASWFAKHVGMTAPPVRLQLVWPDQNGHFPDDPRCDPEVRRLQTATQ